MKHLARNPKRVRERGQEEREETLTIVKGVIKKKILRTERVTEWGKRRCGVVVVVVVMMRVQCAEIDISSVAFHPQQAEQQQHQNEGGIAKREAGRLADYVVVTAPL